MLMTALNQDLATMSTTQMFTILTVLMQRLMGWNAQPLVLLPPADPTRHATLTILIESARRDLQRQRENLQRSLAPAESERLFGDVFTTAEGINLYLAGPDVPALQREAARTALEIINMTAEFDQLGATNVLIPKVNELRQLKMQSFGLTMTRDERIAAEVSLKAGEFIGAAAAYALTFGNLAMNVAMALKNNLMLVEAVEVDWHPQVGEECIYGDWVFRITTINGDHANGTYAGDPHARYAPLAELKPYIRTTSNVLSKYTSGGIEDNRVIGTSVFNSPQDILTPEVYLQQSEMTCSHLASMDLTGLAELPNNHWSMAHAHAVMSEWRKYVNSL
jgi:hypothetical protein